MKHENLYAPAGRQSGGVGGGFSSALSLIIFRVVARSMYAPV
jgi:hypothetical protein